MRASRTFVAVDVSDATRLAVSDVVSRIRSRDDGLSWGDPATYHLTLRFLGEIDEDRLGDVAEAAKEAAADVPPFEMRFGAPGAFPDVNRPRVLFISVAEGADRLRTLAHRLDAALVARGFDSDKRFSPHLTVARVRRLGGRNRICERWRSVGVEVPSTCVDHVIVFESILRPGGAEHIPRARVRLESKEG